MSDLAAQAAAPSLDVATVYSAVVVENARIASGVAVLLSAQDRTAAVVRSTFDADLRAIGVLFDALG